MPQRNSRALRHERQALMMERLVLSPQRCMCRRWEVHLDCGRQSSADSRSSGADLARR